MDRDSQPQDAAAGRHGAYAVVRALPNSYFGKRFLARRQDDGELTWLTVVQDRDAAMLDRLYEAASGCASVRHPLLARGACVERDGAKLLYASEFEEGATVAELLAALAERSEAVPLEILLRIAIDVLDALGALEIAAHAKAGRLPCIHGGVHPQTILVGVDGTTRIVDAGLAAAAAAEPRWSDATARIVHSAPEVARGTGGADVRSDVFALGTLLWQMVACRPLFVSNDPKHAREQVLRAPIPRVFRDRFVRGEPISAKLTDVIERALQRVPAARFGSFGQMVAALQRCGSIAERGEVSAFIERVMGGQLVRGGERSAVVVLADLRRQAVDAPTSPPDGAGGGATRQARRPSVESATPTVRPDPPSSVDGVPGGPADVTWETPLEATLAAASQAARASQPEPREVKAESRDAPPKPPIPPPPAAVAKPRADARIPAPPPAAPPPAAAAPPPPLPAVAAAPTAPDAPAPAVPASVPPVALDIDMVREPDALDASRPTTDDAEPSVLIDHDALAQPEAVVRDAPASAQAHESEAIPPAGDLPQRPAVPTHPYGRMVVVAVLASLALLLAWLMAAGDHDTRAEGEQTTSQPRASSVAQPKVRPSLELAPASPSPTPVRAVEESPRPATDREAVEARTATTETPSPQPGASASSPSEQKSTRAVRRRVRPEPEPTEEIFIPDEI